MAVEVIGVFIPIIFIIVTGLVIVSVVYLRSKEKQMLIDKGFSADQIREFFSERAKEKTDSFIMMQIGIVAIFLGLGIGLGLMFEDWTDKEYWNVLFIFTLTGLGFIIANLTSRKYRKESEKK